MHLLVSVRNAEEAAMAAAGRADIVDAKEPSRGPLGAVAPAVLAAIAARVVEPARLSAALGEGTAASLLEVLDTMPVLPGHRGWMAKFALSGAPSAPVVSGIVARLRGRADAPRLVLARFADRGLDDVMHWLDCASGGGAWGVLLDTAAKDGHSLLDAAPPALLRVVAARARELGLSLALAGGLGPRHVVTLRDAGAQVVGVRGAACDGGRMGRLDPAKVLALRSALGALSSPRAAGVPLA